MKKRYKWENHNRKKNYELIMLLIIMTILNVVFYWKFITGQEYFLVSSDMGIQQYSAVIEWLKNIGGGVKGWSFLNGMGNNYDYSGFMISPNIFLLLFGVKNLKYTFIWYHLIKMYLASIAFFFALTKIGIKEKAAVYGALCYVYSATFIVRSFWESYALEFVLFAFLLYAMECYFQDKNWIILVVAIVLIGSQLQFYYMVVYAIAMLFYALIRNFLITSYKGMEYWKYIGKCAMIMFLSVLILSYKLVQSIMDTFSSSRVANVGTQVGNATTWLELWKLASADRLVAVFNSFFAISLEGSIGGTTFCPNALDGPLFYVGVSTLLLFPQCVKLLNKKGKVVWGILLLFIVVYCAIPAVSYICNLGADEDYFKLSTMWMLVFLIGSAAWTLNKLLEKKELLDKKLLCITYAVLLLLFVGVNIGNITFRERLNIIMFAKVIIFLTVWTVFLLFYMKLKNQRLVYVVFGIILCAEIYFFIHPTLRVAENLADGLKYVVDSEENQKIIDEIKDNEEGEFYRIYFRDQRMSDYNTEPSLYDFNSMGYGSQNVKSEYVDFLNVIEAEPTYRPIWKRSNGFLSRYMIDSLASVKYAVLGENEIAPMGFKKVAEEMGYTVYKNEYCLPLGVVINQEISSEEFEKLSIRQKDVALLNSIVTDKNVENDLDEYENMLNVKSEDILLENMNLEGIQVEQEKDGVIDLNCISDELNRIYVQLTDLQWKNENEYIVSFDFYTSSENNIFIQWNTGDEWKQKVIGVTEGWNAINFTIDCNNTDSLLLYFQKGEYKIGDFHYELSDKQDIDRIYKESIEKKQCLEMSSFSDNLIEGNVESQKNAVLFFMIPFDNNWRVYVDGEQATIEKVDYGFMGVKIGKGKHIIRLEYIPDSNVTNIILSCVGVLIFGMTICVKEYYRKRKI